MIGNINNLEFEIRNYSFQINQPHHFPKNIRCSNIFRNGKRCNSGIDTELQHFASCCSAVKYPTHEACVKVLSDVINQTGHLTTKANLTLLKETNTGKRLRVDLKIISTSQPIVFDITLRNPLQNKNLQKRRNDTYDGDFGLSTAETDKILKYKTAVEEEGMTFIPFAIATTGGTGKKADNFIKTMAAKIVEEKT